MAFHLRHAGEVTFGHAKKKKKKLSSGLVGTKVQN